MADAPVASKSAPVAIVGAGPVGLALALGLARCGVRSILLEKNEATSEHSRAPAIHVRTREVLRQWGVEERLVEAGILRTTLDLHDARSGRGRLMSLDFSEIDDEADRPGLLVLEQGRTERLLLEAVLASGMCDVRFDAEVVRLDNRRNSVELGFCERDRQRSMEVRYAVGCDGASSFVRDSLGLSFEGFTYSIRPMLADVRIDDDRDQLPWPRVWNGAGGFSFTVRLGPGLWRIVHLERGEPDQAEEVPRSELERRVRELLGDGSFETVWASRFRIHRRSSPRFRVGRTLLAGDAAHVHSPAGALGMNAGIHDSHNLAWKLAAALSGGDADRLLDSYEVERQAVVVKTVSRYTNLITRVFLQTPPAARAGAFVALRLAFRSARVRRRALRRTTMLDLDYPSSPLLDTGERSAGIRLPNARLLAPGGEPVRLHDLLSYSPAILDLSSGENDSPLPLERVIRIGPGGYEDPGDIVRSLLKGEDGWILVRPDGCVAWARTTRAGMEAAVRQALGASS